MHEMETFITMAKEDIRNQKFTLQKVRRLFYNIMKGLKRK